MNRRLAGLLMVLAPLGVAVAAWLTFGKEHEAPAYTRPPVVAEVGPNAPKGAGRYPTGG